MKVVKTIADIRKIRQQLTEPVGFVPTMGYLHEGHLSLVVYDLLGQVKATLFDGIREPGTYEATLDGRILAGGVYFYRIQASQADGGQANNYVETKKLVVLK